MWKYAAQLSYLGTRYHGWQRQKADAGHASVQGTLEAAILRITGEACAVVGSGRTDAGVHATGQVAHFRLKQKEWDPAVLRRAMNSLLMPRHGEPTDIQALDVRRVPIEFHAQRSATHKQYSYYFQQGPAPVPHLVPLSWWIRKRLDDAAMGEALAALVGEHDFKAFQARGAPADRSTVRRILAADVTRIPVSFPGAAVPGVEWVRVRLVGTGFLKQMVRGIAGTLLEIGEGRRPATDMAEVLRAQDRALVGQTAPGRALWLERVWYPEGFFPA